MNRFKRDPVPTGGSLKCSRARGVVTILNAKTKQIKRSLSGGQPREGLVAAADACLRHEQTQARRIKHAIKDFAHARLSSIRRQCQKPTTDRPDLKTPQQYISQQWYRCRAISRYVQAYRRWATRRWSGQECPSSRSSVDAISCPSCRSCKQGRSNNSCALVGR